MGTEPVIHEIAPVYDERTRVLILGSFPSVKSREAGFFYYHPQNRFWRVLAAIAGETLPETIEEKIAFLKRRGIGVWDVIASCEIHGSSDSSIREVKPQDLTPILRTADVQQIYTNGKTAFRLYERYLRPQTGRSCLCLPSTSPANASWNLERLIQEWGRELGPWLLRDTE